jgi:1-acyl-sn-glycerol-3-phosphate acyltransferase
MQLIQKISQIGYSAFVWSVIALSTLLVWITLILCWPLSITLDRKRTLGMPVANLWGKTIFTLNPFWHIKIYGKGHIQKGKSYVLAANHASMSDIICLYCMGKHFRWVAKESLFKIPFFGWAMSLLGYIRLRRGEHGSIRDSFENSKRCLHENVSVLYFPEGTRSATGKLGSFKNGAFKLALQTQKPIVPIVLTGTKDILPKGGKIFSNRVNVKIRILKPIPTTGYRENQFAELRELVRSKILDALEQK